jgi:probable HAF family extracellular repeat protein
LFEDLGLLRTYDTSWGHAINNLGQVAGVCRASSSATQHAILYTNRMLDLGTLGRSNLSSHAWDINDKRQVVGWAYSTWYTRSLFLYTPSTGMYDLWTLINWNASDPRLAGTTASNISYGYGAIPYINDWFGHQTSGQICGCLRVNSINNGVQVPFILMPTTN